MAKIVKRFKRSGVALARVRLGEPPPLEADRAKKKAKKSKAKASGSSFVDEWTDAIEKTGGHETFPMDAAGELDDRGDAKARRLGLRDNDEKTDA